MAFILFKQICVLFIIMGLGFLMVKLRAVRADDSRILSLVSVYLILPCAILKSFQISYSPEIGRRFFLAMLSAVLIHILMFAAGYLIKKPLSLNEVELNSLVYSSAANMIIPLITAMLGEDWIIYTSAFLFVQTLLLWSHGQTLMSGENGVNVRRIVTNPNLIAAGAGILLFFTGLRFPSLISEAVSGIAAMIGPVSMITIGMILGGIRWKKTFGYRRIYMIVFLKMILMPLGIVLFLKYSGLSMLATEGKNVLLVSLMAVVTPSASAIVQLAQIYDRNVEYATAINVVTTLICIVTMPALVWVYML